LREQYRGIPPGIPLVLKGACSTCRQNQPHVFLSPRSDLIFTRVQWLLRFARKAYTTFTSLWRRVTGEREVSTLISLGLGRSGLRLSLTSSKSAVSRFKELTLVRLWIAAVLLVVCSMLAGGCISSILGRKDQPPADKKADSKQELVKPKIDTKPEDSRLASAPSRIEAEAEKRETNEEGKVEGSSAPKKPAEKDAKSHSWSDTDRAEKGLQDTKLGASSSSPGADASAPSRRETALSGGARSSTSDTGFLDKPLNPDEPVKRHDHAKYSEHIKNKAIDLVNRDKNSNHAVLCKDTITDQWTLVVYYPKENAYTFVSYLWDEIDEKWQQSFVSDKRPLSGWQTHLKFYSAAKDCKILKRARQ
jgi:hypothetical protein